MTKKFLPKRIPTARVGFFLSSLFFTAMSYAEEFLLLDCTSETKKWETGVTVQVHQNLDYDSTDPSHLYTISHTYTGSVFEGLWASKAIPQEFQTTLEEESKSCIMGPGGNNLFVFSRRQAPDLEEEFYSFYFTADPENGGAFIRYSNGTTTLEMPLVCKKYDVLKR
jgi:hypothetical protein